MCFIGELKYFVGVKETEVQNEERGGSMENTNREREREGGEREREKARATRERKRYKQL